MADVFISYKREDELRVGRLVTALEKVGQSLWWDRGLPGAESWRENIQSELDVAKVVIVCWTHGSVGASGDFVRDEAGRAKARGALIPVLLDSVGPPLGFGELQAIDLRHWRGSLSDPFFRDLLAAIEAKLQGAPVPKPKGPMARLVRRLTIGSVASGALALLVGFGANVMRVQDQICSFGLAQPGLSDVCGALGLGNKPTYEARAAWERLPHGDCAALRDFRENYETSPLRDLADSRLSSRRVETNEEWVVSNRQDPVLFRSALRMTPRPDESLAHAEAIAHAQADAERLCQGFAASSAFRYRGAEPIAQTWHCESKDGGVVCGFDGVAHCDLLEARVIETEACE